MAHAIACSKQHRFGLEFERRLTPRTTQNIGQSEIGSIAYRGLLAALVLAECTNAGAASETGRSNTNTGIDPDEGPNPAGFVER